MARINPNTPLSRLVNARLTELEISRVELMKRLGYTNSAKGLRRFDEFLATGRVTTHVLKGLPDLLGLDAAQVEGVAAATRQQIEDAQDAAARDRFRPHIQVLATWPDGQRMPFFIQAVAYGQKVLALPDDFDRLSSAQQVRQAAKTVRRHFGENGGELTAWGTITGYRVQLTYDHSVFLNVNGTVREGFNRDQETPPPEIRIKGKRVPLGAIAGE